MKKANLLVAGLLCLSVGVFAGEVATNNTGEEATGLRVSFSTPVLITAFGDILTSVDPQMLSFEFVFSGGTVTPWESHWFNYAPATATVIETEWLNQPAGRLAVPAEAATVVDHWRSDVFELTLPVEDGGSPVGTITRTMSVEQIPFVVEYEIELLVGDVTVVWTSEQPTAEEVPQIVEGATARFVYRSNHTDPEVSARFEIDGQEYQWIDPELSFPLHNLTEISLDASILYPDGEISVAWSAANGDPADAVTFPITDPGAAATTLVSNWPNVLTVSCDITKQDSSTVNEEIEVLIYFRDGTPFENRSVNSAINSPMPVSHLDEILDQEFPLLRSLGVNTITVQIIWHFGPPDEDGNWTIHPIWESRNAWPHDPRGSTILMEDFRKYVSRAKEEGFQVYVEMRAFPYLNDLDIEWDHTTYETTFRTTPEWWYSNGEGIQNMFLFYLPDFIRLGIDFVFLGAENGGVERNGGDQTKRYYNEIIEQYRSAGFTGGISYAAGHDGKDQFNFLLLQPEDLGIPYSNMAALSFTYYPILADTASASTIEMQDWARGDIEIFFRPIAQAHNLPVIIEDCYCGGYVDCGIDPLTPGRERGTECSRRYFNAILREFSAENVNSETPWIQGMTIGMYKILADKYVRDFSRDGIVDSPWFNESAERVEIQLAVKVFFSDKPLVSIDGSETEVRPMELVPATTATLSIDDFSRTDLQPVSGRWFIAGAGCASSETDPCNMQVVGLTTGDRYLRVEGVSEKYWCACFEFDEPVDASLFDGIEIVLWADSNPKLEVSLSGRNAAGNMDSFAFPELRSELAAVRTLYRIPFESFLPYSPMTGSGIPDEYLKAVHTISFCVDSGDRAFNIDDLAWFYTLPD